MGGRLYVIRGYVGLCTVSDKIFVFDMRTERWTEASPPPARLAHSHAAICSDGSRFIYVASGQLGPQCSPAIADSFSFDSVREQWRELPPLPEPRYAGTMQLLGDRLHFVGGARSDRYTAATDHWSLAVKEGQAQEPTWRVEPPVPLATMHLGSTVIGDALYTFGGQQGDFTAIPGDPDYTCTGMTQESYFPDVYRYSPSDRKWTRLADMPIPVSHIDFSVIHADGKIHVIGGQVYKHPETFRLRLTDAIQSYDVATNRWSISGVYPCRNKIPVCGTYKGALFCTTGQRDHDSSNDSPGPVVSDTWRMELSRLSTADQSSPTAEGSFSAMRGKEIVLITHDLSTTGSPLLLLEFACALRDSGAIVRIFTLADDASYGNEAERNHFPVLPLETAEAWAARADLVIANTCIAGPWISRYLASHPSRTARLIWWVHENAYEVYARFWPGTENVQTLVFDSCAAQTTWLSQGLGAHSRSWVLHPGNRASLSEAAAEPRLPWPLHPRKKPVSRAQARRLLGVSGKDFLLCIVGTVFAGKGQQLLLETVGRLLDQHPDVRVRVLVVGYKDAEQRHGALQALSDQAKKAVLHGRLLLLQNQEIRAFYIASDAYVMNSQGVGETFGRVTIEAMAFGLPVLGTFGGGTVEIVNPGETGLFHPVGEAGQEILSANILRLARDRALGKRLGEAGRRRAEDYFCARRFHRDMAGIIEKTLGVVSDQSAR